MSSDIIAAIVKELFKDMKQGRQGVFKDEAMYFTRINVDTPHATYSAYVLTLEPHLPTPWACKAFQLLASIASSDGLTINWSTTIDSTAREIRATDRALIGREAGTIWLNDDSDDEIRSSSMYVLPAIK